MRKAHGRASLLAAGPVLVALLLAPGGLPRAAAARTPAQSPAAVTPRATPLPSRSVSRETAPGVGKPAKGDAVSHRVLKGMLLLLVAIGVVGWLFRARVRSWMIGWTRR